MTSAPVVALYRSDPLQVGDVATTPANYGAELGLPWLTHAEHLDVEDPRLKARDTELAAQLTNSIVIVGGGGLTFDYFRDNIAWVVSLRPRVLAWWGAGHNIHLGENTFLTHGQWENLTPEELAYPGYLNDEDFDLIGVRDPEQTQFEQVPFRHVPCPSVMLDALTICRDHTPEHEAVMYVQKSRIPSKVPGYPVLSNATDARHHRSTRKDIDASSIAAAGTASNAVGFLATGQVVVTNSYHGALWALMLNRPAVVLDGWSSKFHKLPARMPIVATSDFERDPRTAIETATKFHAEQPYIEQLLDEARSANRTFARDLAGLLTIRKIVPAPWPGIS